MLLIFSKVYLSFENRVKRVSAHLCKVCDPFVNHMTAYSVTPATR